MSLIFSEELFPEFLVSAIPLEQREIPIAEGKVGGMLSSSGDMTLSLTDKDIEDILETRGKGLSKSELYRRILTESTEPTELLQWESKQVKHSTGPNLANQNTNPGEAFLEELDEGIKNQIRFFLSIAESEGVSSRDVGRYLQERKIGSKPDDMSLLSYVKSRHGNLSSFLRKFPSIFQLNMSISKGTSEYLVGLVSEELNEDDEEPPIIDGNVRDEETDSDHLPSNQIPDVQIEIEPNEKLTDLHTFVTKDSTAENSIAVPQMVNADTPVDGEKPKKRVTRRKKKTAEE